MRKEGGPVVDLKHLIDPTNRNKEEGMMEGQIEIGSKCSSYFGQVHAAR